MTARRPRTNLVHAGIRRSHMGELSEALFLTQGYAYPDAECAERRFNGDEDGFIYSRYANPTVAMFEDRLAALEGAPACMATASGMAAANAVLFCQLSAGDHVVAARALFGSCLYILETLLPRFGVETTFVDGTDTAAWAAAMRPNTRLLFLESPANPTLDICDIPAIAEIAHAGGAKLVVDNVFATPIFQKPFDLGADIVFYSTTKHIDGQGRCLGGAILGDEDFIRDTLFTFCKHTGPSMSPFNAWTMLKGLETLDIRVRAQTETAGRLADVLADSPKIARLRYPGRADHPHHDLAQRIMSGGGTLIAFEVAGQAGAFRFLNGLEIATISNNLGDAKTLATHPGTTTHQRLSEDQRLELGITPGTIRFSVGLEDADDLAEDIARALAAV